ncbi:MAG: inorganic diphosphatase, partial [Candidatus Micrarchaeota archaeon]|nr:inorganic diphosphatase [Candidatus Micrarchaeota archaeon]
PANYGIVVGTNGKDGDPLDVLVLSQPITIGAAIKCKPIGVLDMSDEAGVDPKLIAVPVEKVDPASAEINDIKDMPQYQKDKIKHFFEHMKELE